MRDVLESLDLIRNHDAVAHFIGPRDAGLISQAETVLGLQFPPTYRCFLRRFGCGSIAGLEIYGIVDENFTDSSVPDGVWLTLTEREHSQLPTPLVLITDTGDGGYFAIDTSRTNGSGENPIVVWFPGLSKSLESAETIAEDFGEFLLRRLTEYLSVT